MANIKKIVLTVLTSCLLAIAVSEEEDMLLINYHIHITNDLPLESPANDVPTLYLHCKSKDDDLGEKAMSDEVYFSNDNSTRTNAYPW
ncbi:hypothetical protein HRI_000700400 [Hibiscus trionum]|uniref:S-protein homolog n=1 Tax=Hibiscus trionum TaxID=183268 RepID=A0A9W7LNG7_HIBTR|nr:hypothetical protein HRI_000700400 [Hibiscus trionum]